MRLCGNQGAQTVLPRCHLVPSLALAAALSLSIPFALSFLPYRDRCELKNIMRAVYTYSQGAAYKHNALWLCKRRKTWATAKPPLCRGICTIYVQEQQNQRRRSDVSFPKSRNWQHKLTEVCARVCEGHPNSRGWKVMWVRVCVCVWNKCRLLFSFHYVLHKRQTQALQRNRRRQQSKIQEGYTKDTFYFVAATAAAASVAAVAIAIVCAPSVNEVISAALPTSTLQIDAAADAPWHFVGHATQNASSCPAVRTSPTKKKEGNQTKTKPN